VAQDYYDILQPFDYLVNLLDDNKAGLGIKYIAQHDEELIPEYPCVLVQTDNTLRERHATRQFMVVFLIDLWVFHAQLTDSVAVRSKKDIELATAVRKLLHSKMTLDGHLIDSFVSSENSGISARIVGGSLSTIVTTRLTWQGQNRVRYEDS
jgi:hypothetical protein